MAVFSKQVTVFAAGIGTGTVSRCCLWARLNRRRHGSRHNHCRDEMPAPETSHDLLRAKPIYLQSKRVLSIARDRVAAQGAISSLSCSISEQAAKVASFLCPFWLR